ncbi:transposase [Candidatus Peregrinibacteria bacterium]|nr:transposase [Candidatus Peregrinibacteria bacterium]PIX89697.1 MAG: DDE transposase [Nitrospirae bacterium CG_4_10_14_3_um_filter_44_29]
MSPAQDKQIASFEERLLVSVIPPDHAYRKLNRLINFETIASKLQAAYSHLGQPGIPAIRGLKAMLLQFWEDYSDREMEAAVRENLAIRWFCGFSLTDKTPDHSYFGKFRKRVGAKCLAEIFNSINNRLQKEGLFGNIFYFIDASAIITKTALWEERDKAIKDGHDKLNNLVVRNYAADKEARWGAKSKRNIWFGYKRHSAVDMRYGLISKTTVTPANVLDHQVVEQICPKEGYIFMDKLYDTKKTDQKIKASGCSPGTIRKNNNPDKNYDLDRWRSRMRMPYEGTFATLSKRARYRGKEKVIFQNYGQSICFNLKKALRYIPQAAFN